MSDVAYITNAAATLTFTAGLKTVTVTGTNPILEGVLRGDRAPDPNGMELAIDAVAAGTLTLLRNAPTSGTVQFDIAPVSRLRTSLAANAEVTRDVYAKLLAAVEDNRSIPVISLATAPPGSPADGDRHLVIATATGAFAGKEGYIAQYDAANTRWIFISPIAGMKVTVDGSAVLRIYTGAVWTVSGANDASDIAFTPTGGVVATTVQSAIAEVDSEKMPLSYLDTDGALAANSDTKVATQKAVKTYADTKVTKASGTTAGRLWRFTDTAGGLGQSQMSEDGSGNLAIPGGVTVAAASTFNGDVTFSKANPRIRFTNTAGTASTMLFGSDSGSTFFGTETNSSIAIITNGLTKANFAANGDFSISRAEAAGLVRQTIVNLSAGASVSARYSLQTGTTNATVNYRLADNAGSPFVIEECGAAVTTKYADFPLHVWRSQAGAEWARLSATAFASSVPIKLPSYTVGTVPSASTAGAGAHIYVTNETGGAVPAFSDGTNWRRVTDRAVIS